MDKSVKVLAVGLAVLYLGTGVMVWAEGDEAAAKEDATVAAPAEGGAAAAEEKAAAEPAAVEPAAATEPAAEAAPAAAEEKPAAEDQPAAAEGGAAAAEEKPAAEPAAGNAPEPETVAEKAPEPETVAEKAPEPAAEKPAEAVAEKEPEPVAEKPAEPVAEKEPEPAAEIPAEPVAEKAPEPAAAKPAEPVAEKPVVAEKAPEPIVAKPPEAEPPETPPEYLDVSEKGDMAGSPAIIKLLQKKESQLADAQMRIARLEDSIRKIAAQNKHEQASMHYNMGSAYKTAGDFKRAETELLTAAKLDPADAAVQYNLGLLYDDDLKNKKKAKQHFQRYLELAPNGKDKAKVLEWMKSL